MDHTEQNWHVKCNGHVIRILMGYNQHIIVDKPGVLTALDSWGYNVHICRYTCWIYTHYIYIFYHIMYHYVYPHLTYTHITYIYTHILCIYIYIHIMYIYDGWQ